MKKFLALLLVLCMAFALVACTNDGTQDDTTTAGDDVTNAPETEDVKSEGVMTYAEFDAAALESQVVIETYVQAKQGHWNNDGVDVATIYTQDRDGGYLLYNLPCSKADYDKMVPGTKLKVTGTKTAWEGEVEIIDATYEIIEGSTWVATATDVTAKIGTDDLIKDMNKLVAFKGMEVVAANDDGAAFLYNWDGSGEKGSDLYFNLKVGDKTINVCVESYLCGQDTDVYKAVEALKVGDIIDAEGFLYWYQGANPHITSITSVTVATPAA